MIRQARSAALLLFVLAAALLSTGCTTYTLYASPYQGDLNTLREQGSESWERAGLNTVVTLALYRLPATGFAAASPVDGPQTVIDDVYVLALPSFVPPFENTLQALQVGASFDGQELLYLTGGPEWALRFTSQTYEAYDEARTAAATVVDTGVDPGGILSWGRWAGSPTVSAGAAVDCCDERRSLHYVFGATTPDAGIPTSGTALFRLVGATAPTARDGLLAPGRLDASSTVGVQWGGATPATRVGFDMSGSIGAETFVLNTPGGATSPGSSPITYDPAQRSFGGDVNGGVVSGFFAGEDASHLGVSYSADVAEEFTVQGAAAFAR